MMENIATYFVSLSALVPLVTLVTDYFNKMLKSSGIWKQITAWLVALLLALIGYFFKIGIFESLTWYYALLYGILAGFASNGFYDIKIIEQILNILFKKK